MDGADEGPAAEARLSRGVRLTRADRRGSGSRPGPRRRSSPGPWSSRPPAAAARPPGAQELPLELTDVGERGPLLGILVPAGVEGEDVLLEHPLKQPDHVVTVLQDQPAPRRISGEDLEAELLVEGLRSPQVLHRQADRERTEIHALLLSLRKRWLPNTELRPRQEVLDLEHGPAGRGHPLEAPWWRRSARLASARMPPLGRSRYRFAEFTLSPVRRSLRRGGGEVPLIPRYLDLLLLLVEKRSVALHRQEIFDRVWADVVVSDGALSQAVRTLRRTLGEDGDRAFIRTVSRHGYQFVCPVVEEDDDAGEGAPASAPPPAVDRTASGDRMADALARLLDPAAAEESCRDAAEELHALGTAEALSRLDRRPGHARAWAHLRDSRWDVAGAGDVPLWTPPAGPAAWGTLAGLRLRRALRLAGSRWASASLGGSAAGALAGLAGGLAMAALGGSAEPSLLGALALVGALVAGAGAAGVGFGLAAAEVLVRSFRPVALAIFGAAGGALVGLAAHRIASSLLEALFGLAPPLLGGIFEGLCVGAAAGLGMGLATRRMVDGVPAPRGRRRLVTVAATALACALAGGLVSAAGGRLGAISLDAIVDGFPATRVRLDALGRLFGEADLGPRTRVALGLGEGLLFGAGLAAGLTRRPRRPRGD